jgi:hypothetical protein
MTTLADEQDAAALAYEHAATEEVTGGYVAELAAVVASILAASALVSAGLTTGQAVTALVHRLLKPIRPAMRLPLEREVERGLRLGRAQGNALISRRPPPKSTRTMPVDEELVRSVAEVDRNARAVLDEADRLADLLDLAEEDNVLTVTGKVTSSGKGAEGATRWATNRAVNAGVAESALRAGMRVLWAAERNGCLKCQAYSGLAIGEDQVFPVGLTLGTGKSTLGGVPYPPLHRYCRCRIRPYAGPDATELGEDEASGLQREANRTVARGWSDYASQPERLRAVDLLLKRGFKLPKTVLARAARDRKRGSFSQRHRPLTNLNA